MHLFLVASCYYYVNLVQAEATNHPVSLLLLVALVTSSVALVTTSFLLLLVRHLSLEAMHLFLVASCYYYVNLVQAEATNHPVSLLLLAWHLLLVAWHLLLLASCYY